MDVHSPPPQFPVAPIDWPGFGMVLTAAGLLSEDDADYYLEKPWKWAPEYACWVSAGQPAPPTPEVTSLNWQRFVRAARVAGGHQ